MLLLHRTIPAGTRRAQRYVVGGLIGLVVVVGFILWLVADDETKQADLGAGLLLLLAFERVLSAQTQEVDRKVSLAAAPEPARDDRASAEVVEDEPHEAEGDRQAHPASPTRHFTVEVDTWMLDRSRIDAEQLRLIVYADDQYFQFFTAIVPGAAFRVSIHSAAANGVTLAKFRRGIGELAVRQIRQTIANGEAPRDDDPTLAIALFPNVEEAVRIGRGLVDEDHAEGEIIGEWDD